MEKQNESEVSDQIVVHIAGIDRPGITSTLTQIVSQEGADLIDIGQSVLHGYLTLSAIIRIPPGSDALRKILVAVGRLGLRLEVSSWQTSLHPAIDLPSPTKPFAESLCLTLLGDLKNGAALARTTQFLAERGINIRDIKTLSPESLSTQVGQKTSPLGGIEFTLRRFLGFI